MPNSKLPLHPVLDLHVLLDPPPFATVLSRPAGAARGVGERAFRGADDFVDGINGFCHGIIVSSYESPIRRHGGTMRSARCRE